MVFHGVALHLAPWCGNGAQESAHGACRLRKRYVWVSGGRWEGGGKKEERGGERGSGPSWEGLGSDLEPATQFSPSKGPLGVWITGLWAQVPSKPLELRPVVSGFEVPSLAAIYQGTFDPRRSERSSVPSHPPGRAAPKPCPLAFKRSSAGSLVASLPGLGPGQEVSPSDPTFPRAAVHVLLHCREPTAGLSGRTRPFPQVLYMCSCSHNFDLPRKKEVHILGQLLKSAWNDPCVTRAGGLAAWWASTERPSSGEGWEEALPGPGDSPPGAQSWACSG